MMSPGFGAAPVSRGCGAATTRLRTAGRGQAGFVADRPGHDRRDAVLRDNVDPGKIRREPGHRPPRGFVSGLGEAVRRFCDSRT
jgi:dTDP-D-glucose 4,6-dehydratase